MMLGKTLFAIRLGRFWAIGRYGFSRQTRKDDIEVALIVGEWGEGVHLAEAPRRVYLGHRERTLV